MTTHLFGKIQVAKQTSRKDKTSGSDVYSTQVTALFETIDKNGETEMSMENVTLPMVDLSLLKDSIGKYIVIPYTTINTPKGTYTFPDDNLMYRILEANPLDDIDVDANTKKLTDLNTALKNEIKDLKTKHGSQ